MTPEHFRQIEELYDAARERSPEERAALLARADPALRREVESLLAQPTGGMLLDGPAIQAAAQLLQDSTVTELAAGACLGPYRIESKLGEGGMGEVFRAVDTRLGRAVAVKIARERFSARFEREARAISSLNHPNICTLHDVGPNYLVMELVEGDTIAARLKKGPLSIEMVLRHGAQIAAALAEAHAKCIVHRDLKPGNIMLTKNGAKVLDFGLAKSQDCETLTASRAVMGTPAYMAPEQREGRECDARTDIYALGLVLYEMATGQRPAQDQPVFADHLPEGLAHVIERCLEREPEQRWQTSRDVAAELEWAARPVGRAGSSPARRLPGRPLGRAQLTKLPHRIVAAVAAALALFAAGYLYFHRTPKLTDKDTIVLADFINKTSDPVFDGTLRQGLAVQLEQSPFLSLISDERIQQTLPLMGQPPDAPLTPEIAKVICERTASAAVLEGSIAPIGSAYVLGLRAKNCHTGEVLDEEQVQAARKEDVLSALSQIASKFRTRVGESLATVQQHDTPLEEATTPKLEALKAYSVGWKLIKSTGGGAAPLPHFKRAVEIDPKFAMAYAVMGFAYGLTSESALSAESTGKAYRLRDRASDREKFYITANYDLQVTGDLEKAQQICELWAQTYPREVGPHAFLGGYLYPTFGKYEKAVEEAKKEIEIDPDFPIGYIQLAFNSAFLDRLGEAAHALQRASERKLEIPDFLEQRYDIAFLEGEQAGMERQVALAQGKPGAEDWISCRQAFVLAYSGHLQQAIRMSRRAADLARQAAQPGKAALFEIGPALWEAFFGNAPAARQSAVAALQLSRDRDLEYGAAFALALSRDSTLSRTLAKDLETRFPEDTSVRVTYLPEIRALLALNEPAKAIDLLQIAVPYDLGTPLSTSPGFFGAFYSVYVRGLAYLSARQWAEAAREFQKILDHRAIVVSDPIGALAHLQIGRAFALSGDKTKARAAYQDFLTLWKDADQDIPILQEAKTEYGRLR